MATETITLKLVAQDLMSGNVSKAIGGLDKLARQGGLVGAMAQGVGQSFGQMLNPLGLVTRGIGAMVDVMGDSIRAAQEDALSQARLRAALEANIRAWDGNTDAIEDVIAARMRLGFTDEEQRENLALLVAQVQDVTDALDVQRIAMDLARLKGMDLGEAANVLAKAYNGSATALQRMGIKVKEGARGMEALAGVQERAAGQAEAYANTSIGRMEALNIKLGELGEKFGSLIAGPAADFLGFLDDVISRLAPSGESSLPPRIANLVEQMGKLEGAATAVAGSKLRVTLQEATDSLKEWQEINRLGGNFGVAKWLGMLGPEFVQIANNLGVSTQGLAGLAVESQKAGLSFEEFRSAAFAAVNDTTSMTTTLVDAWLLGSRTVVAAAEEAGEGIYGGLVGPVKKARRDMFKTMTDARGPWKEAMKALRDAATDPFSDDKFAGWMRRKAKKLVDNARRAYRNGGPDMRKEAKALAYVMTNPVLVALANTMEEIQKLANARLVIDIVESNLGDYSRNGSTGRNPKAKLAPSASTKLAPMSGNSGGGGGNGGGGRGNVYVTINVPPFSDAAGMGREVVRLLKAYSRTDGGVGLQSALRATS